MPAESESELQAALTKELREQLGDSYDCTRVWNAWREGTMGEDDFVPVCDRVDEIVDGVMEVMGPLRTENEELRSQQKDHDTHYAAIEKANQRGIEMWQQAHPNADLVAGLPGTTILPGHDTLVEWLLSRLARCEEVSKSQLTIIEELRAEAVALRNALSATMSRPRAGQEGVIHA